MISRNQVILSGLLIGALLSSGCSMKQTFGTAARAGDDVVIPLGWLPDVERTDISVTIQPCTGIWPDGIDPATGLCVQNNGSPINVNQGRLKALARLHPDPVSSLIVDRETNAGTFSASVFTSYAEANFTDKDKELYETMLMMKLPLDTVLSPGLVSIQFVEAGGTVLKPVALEVLPGTNTSNGNTLPYWDESGLPLSYNNLAFLERSPNQLVTFSGTEVPYGVEVTLIHDLDVGHGGPAPVPYVVSPRGDLLSVVWADDGVNMKVTMMPSWSKDVPPQSNESLGNMKHFKFYVAGGVTGLSVVDVKGYDINGVPVPNLTAILN